MQKKNHAADILSLCSQISGFIMIQKRTLNFSLWKCIVCWMLSFVPRGVENNTPSQHWEILLPDTLSCRDAVHLFCLKVKRCSFYIVWDADFPMLAISANIGPVVTQCEHTFEAMYGRSKSWEAWTDGKTLIERQMENITQQGCEWGCVIGSLCLMLLLWNTAGGRGLQLNHSGMLIPRQNHHIPSSTCIERAVPCGRL